MLRRALVSIWTYPLLGLLWSVSPAAAFDDPFNPNYNSQYRRPPASGYAAQPPQRAYNAPDYRARGPYDYGRTANPYQQSYAPQYNAYGAAQDNYYRSQRYSYADPQSGYGFPNTNTQPTYGNSQLRFPDGSGYAAPGNAPRPNAEDEPRRRHRHHRLKRAEDGEEPRMTIRLRNRPAAEYVGSVPLNGQGVVCVRTCDGYFFPLGEASDAGAVNAQASLCTALCPAATTELYLMPPAADGIDTAVSLEGHLYSKMPNAHVYAKGVSAACTCHKADSSQVRLVSLLKDFTLRRGDAVMTTNGLVVFRGAGQWPYKVADFQLLDKAKSYISNSVALAAMEKATKWLQERMPRAKIGGETTAVASFSYVTDAVGKRIRLIGDSPLSLSAGHVSPLQKPADASPATVQVSAEAAKGVLPQKSGGSTSRPVGAVR